MVFNGVWWCSTEHHFFYLLLLVFVAYFATANRKLVGAVHSL